MKITGLDSLSFAASITPTLGEMIGNRTIAEIQFDYEGYDPGFNIILEDKTVFRIRVGTMPSADAYFYICSAGT